MFDNFKSKTKKEKKEVLKTAGKITLGVVGVGALGYLLGFKDGVGAFLDFGLKYNEQNNKKTEEIEVTEEGEA